MKSEEKLVDLSSEYFFNTPSKLAERIYLYPTVAGRFTYMPGYHLLRERYDSFLILLVESGVVEAVLEGKETKVYPGQVLLINCYERHEYGSREGAQVLACFFGVFRQKVGIFVQVGIIFSHVFNIETCFFTKRSVFSKYRFVFTLDIEW